MLCYLLALLVLHVIVCLLTRQTRSPLHFGNLLCDVAVSVKRDVTAILTLTHNSNMNHLSLDIRTKHAIGIWVAFLRMKLHLQVFLPDSHEASAR